MSTLNARSEFVFPVHPAGTVLRWQRALDAWVVVRESSTPDKVASKVTIRFDLDGDLAWQSLVFE